MTKKIGEMNKLTSDLDCNVIIWMELIIGVLS